MGQPLHELLGWPGPITHRQFLTWQTWLEEDWNRPSRADFYVMQLTAEVRHKPVDANYKVPDDFKVSQLRLEFGDPTQQQQRDDMQATEEQAIREADFHAKLRWAKRLGGGVTVSRITAEQASYLNSLPEWEAAQERRRLAGLSTTKQKEGTNGLRS